MRNTRNIVSGKFPLTGQARKKADHGVGRQG